jgi:molecular chaperone IbpA
MFTTNVVKYNVTDIDKLLNDANRFGIGMDEWIRRFATVHESTPNFPPYNLIQESSTQYILEIALAGYRKEDIEVSTEWNKLFVECKKSEDDESEYLHNGIAKRAFTRTWTLSDDVEIGNVNFADGLLTITLNRIIPEHQKKKTYTL